MYYVCMYSISYIPFTFYNVIYISVDNLKEIVLTLMSLTFIYMYNASKNEFIFE